jgi:hypothetical protein
MSRKTVRPGSSLPRQDGLSNHLVHSSRPLWGDEVETRVEDDHTDGYVVQPDGTNLRRSNVIVPCPNCGDVKYLVGPLGLPERKCWACGYVFTPEITRLDNPAQVIAWWKAKAKYNWSGTIRELVEGLASGKPLKLTIATVPVLPEPAPIEGRKQCPNGHVCDKEPTGAPLCCGDPRQEEEEGDSSDPSTR